MKSTAQTKTSGWFETSLRLVQELGYQCITNGEVFE